MFDTTALGTLLSLKHELRVMQSKGSGSIMNISSTMGERGAADLWTFTASLLAVEGLTKSAAPSSPPSVSCELSLAWSNRDRDARSSDRQA